MGLFSSITKLFSKDTQVDECCADGVCTCSSNVNDPVSGTTVSTSTYTSSNTVDIVDLEYSESTSCCEEGKCTCGEYVEKSSVTATADEINMALETAAEADRIAAENYTPTLPPVSPPKKKKSNIKKANSKLNRKSSTRKKKN